MWRYWGKNIITMNEDDTNRVPSPMANEPGAVYAKLSQEHHSKAQMQSGEFHKGSMSVDEFCNMLHRYVDEYYDSIENPVTQYPSHSVTQ